MKIAPLIFLIPWLVDSAFSTPTPPTPAPKPTIESVINSDWKWLDLAFVDVVSCLGPLPRDSIFLARSGNAFTVYKITRDEDWNEHFTKGRPVRTSEAYQIISRFLSFYIQAINETSLNEHFQAMPSDIRDREMRKYFHINGTPYGGFDKAQIVLTYALGDSPKNSFSDEFVDGGSCDDLIAWIKAEKGE